MIQRTCIRTVAAATLAALLVAGCTGNGGSSDRKDFARGKATVGNNGTSIVFPAGSPGLEHMRTARVARSSILISVIAPARVVASILNEGPEGIRTVLFDAPDVTSLYSQYRQAKTNVEKTGKALAHVTEMYDAQGATVRDLNDATTDAASSRTAMAEYEGKLRTLGFNAAELESAHPGTIWLISDVAESQLGDVQKGEEVDIFFAAFPDKKLVGRAVAIGDVIDPVTRTVKVRVVLGNPGRQLLPGMFARIDFGDPVDGVIPVPTSAIVTVEGKDFVFVKGHEGEFVRREITIGNANATQAIVSRGLEPGDSVVVAGAMLLKGLSFGY